MQRNVEWEKEQNKKTTHFWCIVIIRLHAENQKNTWESCIDWVLKATLRKQKGKNCPIWREQKKENILFCC